MTASLKMCYTRESLVDKIHFPLQSGISMNVVVDSEETIKTALTIVRFYTQYVRCRLFVVDLIIAEIALQINSITL